MVGLFAALTVVLLDTLWIGLILVGIPGTWLMIATAALVDWLADTDLFHPWTLFAAVALAATGELLEFLASMSGARRAEGTRSGAAGALLGGLIGAIAGTFMVPVPVFGSLVGGAAGAFAGATLMERGGGREIREALRVGRGAAAGHVIGILAKLALGVAVWVLLAVAAFVP